MSLLAATPRCTGMHTHGRRPSLTARSLAGGLTCTVSQAAPRHLGSQSPMCSRPTRGFAIVSAPPYPVHSAVTLHLIAARVQAQCIRRVHLPVPTSHTATPTNPPSFPGVSLCSFSVCGHDAQLPSGAEWGARRRWLADNGHRCTWVRCAEQHWQPLELERFWWGLLHPGGMLDCVDSATTQAGGLCLRCSFCRCFRRSGYRRRHHLLDVLCQLVRRRHRLPDESWVHGRQGELPIVLCDLARRQRRLLGPGQRHWQG